MLFNLTVSVNLLFLVVSVWLGLYLVSRNPRSRIAQLTGLALWMIGGLFLNILFALNPPVLPAERPFWLRVLMVFWAGPVTGAGEQTWLTGWSIAFGIVLWHHVTTLMRGPLNTWRRVRIGFGYVLALAAVLVRMYTPLLYVTEQGNPLYLDTMEGGALYPFFAVMILFFTGWSFINLIRSSRAAESPVVRKQLETLATATAFASLAGPLSIASSGFGIRIPMVLVSLLLGIAVAQVGYGVAVYSALSNGRTMRRDFLYSAVSLVVMLAFYLAITWLMLEIYDLPHAVYVFSALVATLTHSFYGWAGQLLDRLFLQPETRALRANLRQLRRLAAEQEDLGESLGVTLGTVCTAVRAVGGLVVVFEDGQVATRASFRWHNDQPALSREALAADDYIELAPGALPAPLDEAALLVPLYADNEQLGALILGRPVNGVRYADRDIDQLLYASDSMGAALGRARRERAYLQQVSALAEAQKKKARAEAGTAVRVDVKAVEQALRNLKDYAFLGDSPLGRLKLVDRELDGGQVTHIDRGKAVCSVVTGALEKLRPDGGKEPGDLAPREWHAYLVLHDSYIKDRMNREIMSRLYISEGTFNRTRRAALRALARLLGEMEAAVEE